MQITKTERGFSVFANEQDDGSGHYGEYRLEVKPEGVRVYQQGYSKEYLWPSVFNTTYAAIRMVLWDFL